MRIKFHILVFFFLFSGLAKAQSIKEENLDTLAVSILTVEPSKDPSSLFGHISIRIQDKKNHTDITYHHGGYNSDVSFFPVRFVLGWIFAYDYNLPYDKFCAKYLEEGRSFTSLELNLKPNEKAKLIETIKDYSTSGYTYYRYDYLRENCSTKVINAIRRSVDGEIRYRQDNGFVSLRMLIASYCNGSPWTNLFLNLLMGYGFDKGLSIDEQNFLPRTLTDNLRKASIIEENGTERKLTSSKIETYTPAKSVINHKTICSPLFAGWTFLLFFFIISLYELKKSSIMWILDILLYGIFGLAGCFISFVCLKSTMPYMETNLLVILFNPIHLIYLPIMIWLIIKKRKDYYHVINLFLFSAFLILFKATPQVFPIELIPVALIFILRSGIYILFRFFPNYLTSNR